MRSYEDVCLILGVRAACLGADCGLSANRHKAGTIFLGVVHWRERRVTRAGLRRFLLLIVRRERESNPEFLNSPNLAWYAIYWDSTEAGRLAAQLGVRLPAVLSRNDRLRCLTAARKAGIRLSSAAPAVYAWARRGTE